MKNKKNLYLVIIYTAIVLICAGLLVVYNQKLINESTVYVYVANQDIPEGTTISSQIVLQSYTEYEQRHQEEVDSIASYGSTPITSSEVNNIINKVTTSEIKAGTILVTQYFSAIVEENLYEGITNPVSIEINVSSSDLPYEGLTVGDNITVIGILSLSEMSDVTASDDNTISMSSETWIGIVSNNVILENITYDDSKNPTSINVIVGTNELATMLALRDKELFFVEGKLTDLSEIESDIIVNLYNSAGLNDDRTLTVELLSSSGEQFEIPIYSEESTLEESNITFIQNLNDFELSMYWEGSPTTIYVNHYSLSDGARGDLFGYFSYNSSVNGKQVKYDYNTGEHYVEQSFEEGYYEIFYYNYYNDCVGKAYFVIEQSQYDFEVSGYVLNKLSEQSSNSATSLTISDNYYNVSLVKSYFSLINDLENYCETISLNDALESHIINQSTSIGSIGDKIIEMVYVEIPNIGLFPIYFYTDDVFYDIAATTAQVERLNELLGTSFSTEQITAKNISYTQLYNIINELSLYELVLYEEDMVTNEKEYSLVAYFLRYILFGELMTDENCINSIYSIYVNYSIVGDVLVPYATGDTLKLVYELSDGSYVYVDYNLIWDGMWNNILITNDDEEDE